MRERYSFEGDLLIGVVQYFVNVIINKKVVLVLLSQDLKKKGKMQKKLLSFVKNVLLKENTNS